jgi:16S rRNA (cytosine1402-N4)-methyltransferase
MAADKIKTNESTSMTGGHMSIMLEEAIEILNVRPGYIYVDATAGAGGHLKKICQKNGSGQDIIAIDQDLQAIEKLQNSADKIAKEVKFIHANFSELTGALAGLGISTINGGIIADLGISSNQLDNSERGFSFQREGPLDMRMDRDNSITAEKLVNELNETELANIIYKYGEERNSRAIARAIIKQRPLHTTTQLVSAIESVNKFRSYKIHPATRTFQALRIAVNKELENLEIFLQQTSVLLSPGARLVIIAFHSLEDRIVKRFFTHMASPCICPPRQPICTCQKKKEFKIITPKPVTASDEEILANIRSRSAKLRAAEKIT